MCIYIYIHTCVKYIHIYPVCVYKQFNQPLNVSIGKGSEETVFVFEAFAIIVGETEPTDGTQWWVLQAWHKQTCVGHERREGRLLAGSGIGWRGKGKKKLDVIGHISGFFPSSTEGKALVIFQCLSSMALRLLVALSVKPAFCPCYCWKSGLMWPRKEIRWSVFQLPVHSHVQICAKLFFCFSW